MVGLTAGAGPIRVDPVLGVDTVLVDVGGVLVTPDPDLILPLLADLGAASATADDVRRGHYAGVAVLDRGDGEDWSGYWSALARACGADGPAVHAALAPVLTDTWLWTREVPGAVPALADLVAAGFAVVVVSNSDGMVGQVLAARGICQVGPGPGVPLHGLLDSGRVGVAKPDPAMFRMALDLVGGRPERTVHVGDTVSRDIVGARAAGIRPLHVDPYGDCPGCDGHRHVISFADAALAIRAGSAAGAPGTDQSNG